MFGKSGNNVGSYNNVNSAGSEFLRNTIRARVYMGIDGIERKLTQYQLYWKYYNNQHWADNNDQLLSFNYVRAVVDKVNNFIIGKDGIEFNIKDLTGDKVPDQVERAYEALLKYNWNKNKMKLLLHKLLQMGSVCGDAYVFFYPNRAKRFVEYQLMDSRTCIPIFDEYDEIEPIGYRVVKLLGKNAKGYIQKVTEYRVGLVRTFFVKETGDLADKFELEEEVNDYDFVPIVHIENIAMSDTYGGKSDMEDIVKINKIYNEMAEDIKMIIDYYSQPTTVITGGTVGQLKRGINQIWSGLPADANVFNLGLGEDLAAATSFLKMLKDAIHDLSGVPEEVLSKVQHISNTSAAALQMLYQPIIQAADKKTVSYGEGIQRLNEMTLLMYRDSLSETAIWKKMPVGAKEDDFADKYSPVTVWKYNLPSDRLSMLTEAQIELNTGTGSRREVMERLGKENIPKLLTEIEEDLTYLQRKTEAGSPPAAPEGGDEPPPDKEEGAETDPPAKTE